MTTSPDRTVAQNLMRQTFRQGIPGAAAGPINPWSRRTIVNGSGSQVQIDTATISGSASGSIGFNIDGAQVRVTATGTAATDAQALVDEVNGDPFTYGRVTATRSSAVVTLTGKTPGRSYTVNGATSSVALASVASPTNRDDLKCGRAVIATGTVDDDELAVNVTGVVASAAGLLKRSVDLTVGYHASGTYAVTVRPRFGGAPVTVLVAADTSASVTATAIATALDDALTSADYKIGATHSSAVVTIEADVEGYAFDVTAYAIGNASATLAITDDNGSDPRTDFDRVFMGIALYREDNGNVTIDDNGSPGYSYGKPAEVSDDYESNVESSDTVEFGGIVYVELAAGATAGRFYKDDSATRVPTRRAKWIRRARSTAYWGGSPTITDTVAVLQVRPYALG